VVLDSVADVAAVLAQTDNLIALIVYQGFAGKVFRLMCRLEQGQGGQWQRYHCARRPSGSRFPGLR